MDAISYGLNQIFSLVDNELLKRAFAPKPLYARSNLYSLEELVRSAVIKNYVNVECNLSGGQIVEIDITDAPYQELEGGMVFDVPLHLTHGREIMEVLSLETKGRSCGPVVSGPAQGTGTSRVHSLDGNRFYCEEIIYGPSIFLRCRLANDENMSNVSRRAWRTYGQLCVLGAKMLIYTKLQSNIDSARISGGDSNDNLVSVLSTYESAEEEFNIKLEEEWYKTAIMADDVGARRTIIMGLPRQS